MAFVRDKLLDIIYAVTGLNLSSWDAFLLSLQDGKGIDLPGIDLNLTGLLTGLLTAPANFIGSIGGVLMDGVKTVQNFLDGLRNAFVGGIGTGFDISGVTAAATSLASQANAALTNVTSLAASLLGTPETVIGNIQNVLMDVGHSVQNFLDNLHNAFVGGSSTGNGVASVGSAASSVASTASSASTMASTAISNVTVLQNTLGGTYTAVRLTSSGTWTVPTGKILEFVAVCIGAGWNGSNGSGAAGGVGGAGGDFTSQTIDPSLLGTAGSTISYTIGSSSGADTTFGSLATSAGGSGTAVIAGPFGFIASISSPGAGGNGGSSSGSSSGVTAGAAGGSTPLGTSGTAGTRSASASPGGNGGTGGAADNPGSSRAGGGGGGGGGGSFTGTGGNGGNGGIPGGGGGGGGGGGLGGPGSGGTGARGELILVYKLV
jgi:hypothetical protein